MAATIKDVARLAGVSPSTVSRVLNQKGVISEETKQKIASAMEQLKYVPNDIARSFANGSAHAISLVIDISDGTAYANNFFNNTVFGIETAAHRNDYNLIITNGAAAFGGISSVERLIAGKKVDGVVLPISLVTDELLRDLRAALAARFRAAQNSTLTRTAIRSAVLLVLQDYRARGWLSAFGDLRVYADAGDASLCRVEFTYSIPAGLHRIALSAQMTG